MNFAAAKTRSEVQRVYDVEMKMQLITARERKHNIIGDARDSYEVRCIANRERREDLRHQYNLRMMELATGKD